MRKLLLVLSSYLLLSAAPTAYHSSDILGQWQHREKNFRVEIYQEGGIYYGRLSWLRYNTDEIGAPLTDQYNPDPKLRNRRIEGLTILEGLQYHGNGKYTGGRVYDFRSGRSYRAMITLQKMDEAVLRGYIGVPMLGKNDYFARYKQ